MADMDDNPPVKKVNISKLKAVAASDTITTPKGNIVTKQEYLKAKANGLPFGSHQDYADYVDSYAHPIGKQTPPSPNKTGGNSVPLSDKAAGYSNSYYPASQSTKTPDAIKSNRY